MVTSRSEAQHVVQILAALAGQKRFPFRLLHTGQIIPPLYGTIRGVRPQRGAEDVGVAL